MYAVVNRLRLGSPIAPDVWHRAQAELPPRMREIEGFCGFHVIEVSSDEVVLVILADAAETLDHIATDVGGPWMRENVIPHLAEPPDRQIGRVVASETR